MTRTPARKIRVSQTEAGLPAVPGLEHPQGSANPDQTRQLIPTKTATLPVMGWLFSFPAGKTSGKSPAQPYSC
jgi:hypothetical protein